MFSAEKDMEIETDTKFEIKAQEAIYLLCKESSIVLDGETDIQGTVLKVDGLIKSPVSVADLEPEPQSQRTQLRRHRRRRRKRASGEVYWMACSWR